MPSRPSSLPRRRTTPALSGLSGLVALATAATGSVLVVLAASPASAAPTDRYVVQFTPGQVSQGKSSVRDADGDIVLTIPGQAAAAAVVPDGKVAALRSARGVASVEKDVLRYPTSVLPSTAKPGGKPGGGSTPPPAPLPSYSDSTTGGETTPYGIKMTQADQVSAASAAKKSVCIIDSGYYAGHDDLVDEGPLVSGTDSAAGPWDVDGFGHGTHVAGTISAPVNGLGVVGVDPGVTLHVVRVFGDDGAYAYGSDLAAAVTDCRAAGSNVISMSLGGSASSRVEQNAFDAAYAAGVLPVAAAGNGGNTRTEYPAGYGSVVSVAAVDSSGAHADFSQTNRDVEIAAPGVHVLSTVPYTEDASLTVNGTTLVGSTMEGSAQTAGTSATVVDGGDCGTASTTWSGKIVLCRRGTQTFVDKTLNVQGAGGTAAVIYNNVSGDFSGSVTGAAVTIPAISLSDTAGATAVANAGRSGTVVNLVTKPASGYAYYDGTSMATPHVAAVAAKVWSLRPSASASQVRTALTSSAYDLGTAGRDTSYGFGLVQARQALTALGG